MILSILLFSFCYFDCSTLIGDHQQTDVIMTRPDEFIFRNIERVEYRISDFYRATYQRTAAPKRFRALRPTAQPTDADTSHIIL